MADLVHVTASTFEAEVKNSSLPVLVDFFADWCPPCQKLGPTLEEVAVELEGQLKIVKVNVQEASDLATEFGVMNIPTLILFKAGEEVNRIVGNRPKKRLISDLSEYL